MVGYLIDEIVLAYPLRKDAFCAAGLIASIYMFFDDRGLSHLLLVSLPEADGSVNPSLGTRPDTQSEPVAQVGIQVELCKDADALQGFSASAHRVGIGDAVVASHDRIGWRVLASVFVVPVYAITTVHGRGNRAAPKASIP